MLIDSQLSFSDAQALTATAASTNVIDLSQDRNIGIGEPISVVLTVDVALAGTSPTFAVSLQTATDAAFTTPVTLLTMPTLSGASAMPQGLKLDILYPGGPEMLQFLRLNYTLGGTSPTVTVTAEVQPSNEVQNAEVFYPNNYTIS